MDPPTGMTQIQEPTGDDVVEDDVGHGPGGGDSMFLGLEGEDDDEDALADRSWNVGDTPTSSMLAYNDRGGDENVHVNHGGNDDGVVDNDNCGGNDIDDEGRWEWAKTGHQEVG